MSGPPDDIEARLRQRPRPHLPGDLKSRVMATAVLAQPSASWRDRVFFSRTWRLAAAAMLLALAVLDYWSAGWTRTATPGSGRAGVEELIAACGLGPELGVPEHLVRRLASRVEFAQLPAQESRGSIDPDLR